MSADSPGQAAPPPENPDALQKRLDLARQIFVMFRLERTVHLVLNAITFVILIGAAIWVILKGGADKAALTLICGSGGLIGFTSSRLLSMWTDVLNRVFGKQ
ncbi:MAG: hypothetical protein JST11_13650 [Acidobacteria bacterium]|nr:hypothetical protein [Acidobacteriota bacterium]